jgi:hypothetical protein
MVLALLVAACGAGDETAAVESVVPAAGCADVVAVEITQEAAGTFLVATTVRSADTGWEKYADRWEVVAPDGTVLTTRVLAHPHVDEQPFTRSQPGVVIPEEVTQVTVRANDSVAGLCGLEMMVVVPR